MHSPISRERFMFWRVEWGHRRHRSSPTVWIGTNLRLISLYDAGTSHPAKYHPDHPGASLVYLLGNHSVSLWDRMSPVMRKRRDRCCKAETGSSPDCSMSPGEETGLHLLVPSRLDGDIWRQYLCCAVSFDGFCLAYADDPCGGLWKTIGPRRQCGRPSSSPRPA